MAGLGDLTAQSLGSSKAFNWTWFIELITSGILVVWFFFYFNRLLATILSWTIRTYTWHTFRVYIDIQAIQISLLGGRIFFKGVRYHGQNETVYVHSGHLTWRYWLRSTRRIDLTKEEVGSTDEVKTKPPSSKATSNDFGSESGLKGPRVTHTDNSSEARLLVSVTGLEWFIYNRTPVYDSIIKSAEDGALPESKSPQASRATVAVTKVVEQKLRRKSKLRRPSSGEAKDLKLDNEIDAEKDAPNRPSWKRAQTQQSTASQSSASTQQDAEMNSSEVSSSYTFILKFMPLAIECGRGSISLGNEHTRALIVTTFEKARGHIDAGGSGPADIFKQIFDFDIEHPLVQMRPNPDYNLPQMTAAERIIAGSGAVLKRRPWWKLDFHLHRRRRDVIQSLRNLVPGFHRSVESFHGSKEHEKLDQPYLHYSAAQPDTANWHGLDRYVDDDDADDHHAWVNIEYARFSTILDCPKVHLEFYWDTPGSVKPEHLEIQETGFAKDINGIRPPGYGLYLAAHGGTVNYGPWADRMRAELQSIFFPASYKSAVPFLRLLVGQTRQSSLMNIRVDIREEITLRIPVREGSKDWRWRGRAMAVRDAAALRRQQERRHFRFRRANKRRIGPEIRPFGWFSISVGSGSTISYVMDMYPGFDGYRNDLQLHLKDTKATSSVNHALLWHCREQNVSCDLSNPLGWHDLHKWRFDLDNQDMDLYLLRDHTFLLIDLISDFTAGQKSDYMTFMPFCYDIGVNFRNFKLFLNANDYNIIDNPTELDENAFLILGFERLNGEVSIPMKLFSPPHSGVHFKGKGSDAFLMLKLPLWNTLHTFAPDETMATLKTLDLDGVYNYYSATTSDLTDSLFMTIIGGHPEFYLQGFLIRYFMNVKENYFGEHVHFSTLEEHTARLASENLPSSHNKRTPSKKSNDLDVILSVRADESSVLMPVNIYERSETVRIDVLLVEADMRFTNYYMDLQVNTSPVEVSLEIEKKEDEDKVKDTTSCQLFIDGIAVYGHRLFGAPPTEPTYVCNWDFDVGYITGECSSQFVQKTIAAVLAFIFTMDDEENALPLNEVVVPDITFLRARAAGVTLWLVTSETAFLLEASPTTISLNDWAKAHFSKEVEVDLPGLTVAAVEARSAYRQRDLAEQKVETLACAMTALKISVLNRKADFVLNRLKQQQHVRFHDQRTHRTEWLLHRHLRAANAQDGGEWSKHPPAMPLPVMPEPVLLPEPSTGLNSKSTFRDPMLMTSRNLSKSMMNQNELVQKIGRREHLSPENEGNSHPSVEKADVRMSTGNVFASSPWNAPQFPLLKVRPDLSSMPDGKDFVHKLRPTLSEPSMDIDPENNEDSPKHDGIFCNFVDGVRCFCTPELFVAIARLLDDLSPHSPSSVLDAIQIKTIANIQALTVKKANQIDDIAVHLPYARVRMLSDTVPLVSDTDFDQYDVELNKTALTMRLAPRPLGRDLSQLGVHDMLIYTSVESLHIEASEFHPAQQVSKVSAKVSISDTSLWLSLQQAVRARAQLNSFQFNIVGRDIDLLAGLIYRTETMVEGIITCIEGVGSATELPHLVYHLAKEVENSEPVFLSRPSYVLRTAAEHVRFHDAWKIISKLRSNWLYLRDTVGQESVCAKDCVERGNLDEMRQYVRSVFNRWKSWDSSESTNEPIMNAVFGSFKTKNSSSAEDQDLEVELLLGYAAFTLDPGPHQTQFSLRNVDLNLSDKFVKESDAGWKMHTVSTRRRLVIQSYFGDIALKLSWELMELAESLIRLTNNAPQKQVVADLEEQTSKIDSSKEYVILVGVDATALQIDTLNLRLLSGTDKLRASFMSIPAEHGQDDINMIIASSSARLRLYQKQTSLLAWRLNFPSIYGSVIHLSKDDASIRVGATCNKLRFKMSQDILGLLDVTKTILEQEVPAVKRVVSNIEPTKSVNPQPTKTMQNRLPLVNMVLLLNDYKLDFAVLPYLRYVIAGKVARTSVLPRSASRFTIDMDLKESFHFFQNIHTNLDDRIPSLNMPPLNARVSLSILPDRFAIDALATMELIQLQASAVKACFDAAYQQSTTDYLNHVKHSIESVQEMIFQMSSSTKEGSKPLRQQSPGRLIQYSARVVLAGLEVFCSAPVLKSEQSYRAELRFGFGQTSILVHNNRTEFERTFSRPQFELKVSEIQIAIGKNSAVHQNAGRLSVGVHLIANTEFDEDGSEIQRYQMLSNGIELNLYEETVMLAINLSTFLQQRIKNLVEADDGKRLQSLRRMTISSIDRHATNHHASLDETSSTTQPLMSSVYVVDIHAIRVKWILKEQHGYVTHRANHNLVFSIERIDLKTRRDGSGRLAIRGMQLQIVPKQHNDPVQRSASSALLPEMVFNAAHLSTKEDRRFAFKAAGKAVDVRLAADFIIPASMIQKSIARASIELQEFRKASPKEDFQSSRPQLPQFLRKKRLASLLVYADFAGTIVTVTPRREETVSAFGFLKGPKRSRAGRYGQAVQSGNSDEATLRAPGIAFKIEYKDNGKEDPSLSTEIKVAASSNTLAPSVVPLLQEISSSITDVMGQENKERQNETKPGASSPSKGLSSDGVVEASDPAAILGRVKLNAGLWVQKQEFSLTCQPIARVSATARFDEIFVNISTVQPQDQDRFFSVMTTFSNLSASVQHVYSRESTASFAVKSISVSLMNSKHFSNKSGLSAILTVSPMKADMNAKQLQDFLLFREIWYPAELRHSPKPQVVAQDDILMQGNAIQRFQEISETAAVPWHAIVSISELQFQVDFGQSLGKSNFIVSKLWASSKKTSESEQNLCIGFEKVGVNSTGRMSGFVELQDFRVRTAIKWPRVDDVVQAPLVQGSIGFEHLRAKLAFDYQPFGVADISAFQLLMYNVRDRDSKASDRLVAILDGGKVQTFFTTSAAAQGLAIFQAFEKLIQEKQEAYQTSLHELDRYLRRRSVFPTSNWGTTAEADDESKHELTSSIQTASLNTDVVITIKAIDIGAFPTTFFDQQMLKVEAVDVQARFAVGQGSGGKMHSGLGMSLGQVGVALANVSRPTAKALGEVSVPEIIERATSSRGGTILRVPRLVASMQTWQQPDSNIIEYIFRSVFQGKVDVGWNYSRISFIRTMWENHSRALTQRMGKPMPPSALKITAEPQDADVGGAGQAKITAVVNMPQSKYEYIPLEPPIIDTPQLRDLGEATPSLEWIGLHREKLPNVTHSVIIVTLLELAREVEGSYHRILGST